MLQKKTGSDLSCFSNHSTDHIDLIEKQGSTETSLILSYSIIYIDINTCLLTTFLIKTALISIVPTFPTK